MSRYLILLALPLAIALLFLTGCFQELKRPEAVIPSTPAPSPVLTPPLPTPTPTPTPKPPTPTPPPTRRPEATRPPSPTPVPSLFLEVRGPVDGSIVRSNMIVVFGIASPGGTVHINGAVLEVGQGGRFQAEVAVSPGANQIEVIAIDSAGNREREVITVTLIPPPPFFLSVTEPQNQSVVTSPTVRLTGRTSLDASVSVNGVFITVDDLGIFSTRVTLRPGPNILDVMATNAEETVDIQIAVIYSP